MKDQLITFGTAKLAKEKGFDIETDKVYYFTRLTYPTKLENWNTDENYYSVPTQSLLQKWLREVHDITIWFSDWEIKEYSVNVNQGDITEYMPMKSLGTYEEALEIGLFEALKLIN